MDPASYYSTRLEEFKLSEQKLSSKIRYLSLARLLTMAAFIYLIIKGIKQENLILSAIAVLMLVSFFILLSLWKRKNDERKKKRILIEMNEKELEALDGNYNKFTAGTHFLDAEHEFTYDLDIFGPYSLFQYMCRCCTLEGERTFASRFLNSPLDEKDILENQKIHRDISRNPDFMQNYLASGISIDEKPGEIENLKNWLKKSGTGISRGVHIAAYVLASATVVLIVLTIVLTGWLKYLIIIIIANWFFYGFYMGRINKYHNEISNKQEVIKKYIVLSRELSKGKFESGFMKLAIRKAGESLDSFRILEKLMDLFDTRLNLLAGPILNTLTLLDFHTISFLERWKKKNNTLIPEVLRLHAETDAYISGAIFSFNHPHFKDPEILRKGKLSASGIGHPLILRHTCILNDIHLESNEKVIIVTGANMAGKSTFLRTLGVNLILAGAGFPVYAEEFRFERTQVITGMRTTDSLAESESYFFAELKRMKRIMDRLRAGERLFVLLDEILKGTNSADKHKGSEELLKQILEHDCTVFIATHDIGLGKLEKEFPGHIRNYHFESFIEEGELKFDYKFREGIAKNMNASFLLKKMGVLKA